MSQGQNSFQGDCLLGFYRVLIEGLLGFIWRVLAMAQNELGCWLGFGECNYVLLGTWYECNCGDCH